MTQQSKLKDEDGSTLVETLVAMAILVSVLLPTTLFLGFIAANPMNKEKITALGLAQSEMERVLASKEYPGTERVVEDQWIIKRVVSKKKKLVQVEVSVYRKNRTQPILTLNTERLLYENDVSQ